MYRDGAVQAKNTRKRELSKQIEEQATITNITSKPPIAGKGPYNKNIIVNNTGDYTKIVYSADINIPVEGEYSVDASLVGPISTFRDIAGLAESPTHSAEYHLTKGVHKATFIFVNTRCPNDARIIFTPSDLNKPISYSLKITIDLLKSGYRTYDMLIYRKVFTSKVQEYSSNNFYLHCLQSQR